MRVCVTQIFYLGSGHKMACSSQFAIEKWKLFPTFLGARNFLKIYMHVFLDFNNQNYS